MSHEDTNQQEIQSDAHSSRINPEKSMTAKRDLGTAGGGNIPGVDVEISTSHDIINESSNTGGSDTSDEDGEHESVKNSSKETSPAGINTVDKQAQTSNGGRHPSQPQTAMGDQDSTQKRTGEEVADPMTSRAPDKINQKQKR